jgi:hypothetical protein
VSCALDGDAPPALLRWEPYVVCAIAWAALLAPSVSAGALGLSWDALNHHIYLGWTAEHPRFGQDFLAAGNQSYQFPYLYWPMYKMANLGWTGLSAALVLASLQALAIPAVWMIARVCIPGPSVFDVALRSLAVLLGLLSGVVLSMLDSTQNDPLAAVPLVWAIAFAARAIDPGLDVVAARRRVVLSGALAGLSVAAKLSNGPLAIVLPGLWLLASGCLRARVVTVAAGSVTTVAAFILAYGYWGLQVWRDTGNPFHPFLRGLFPVFRLLGGAG